MTTDTLKTKDNTAPHDAAAGIMRNYLGEGFSLEWFLPELCRSQAVAGDAKSGQANGNPPKPVAGNSSAHRGHEQPSASSPEANPVGTFADGLIAGHTTPETGDKHAQPKSLPPRNITGPASAEFDGSVLLGGELPEIAELRPHSHHRRLDFRWQLARHVLVSPESPARKYFDRPTARALRFQTVLLACRSKKDFRALARQEAPLPAILDAFNLWRRDDAYRAEIEARVLSGEASSDIARRFSLPAGVVSWYERLFFAVRDRLSSPDWIMTHVIPKEFYTNPAALGLPGWWKYYGYWGGPHVLDLLVYGGFSAKRQIAQGDVFGFLRETTLSLLKQRAAIAARTLPIGEPRTALWMVRALLRQVKREQKQPAADGDEKLRQMLNAMRQAWPALWEGEEGGALK